MYQWIAGHDSLRKIIYFYKDLPLSPKHILKEGSAGLMSLFLYNCLSLDVTSVSPCTFFARLFYFIKCYFSSCSLDIEGDELHVLKTLPMDKVNIKMLSVEYAHEEGGRQHLDTFMAQHGYQLLKTLRDDSIYGKNGSYHPVL
jgi:hypothetical protein